jgi:metallophosphoesterase (TIGR03767 family)
MIDEGGLPAVIEFPRRTFFKTAGIGAAVLLGATKGVPRAFAEPSSVRGFYRAGTTLDTVGVPAASGPGAYRSLVAGPAWPLVVRTELAQPRADRDSRRTALASIVQTTDVHLVDAQSPVRAEFVRTLNSSAFRSFETMGTHGAVSLIERINALESGPFSGRRFDCVVSTGDNTDNHEHAELDWFLTVFDGGTLTPNTGDPARYEGVQTWGSTLYWQPESSVPDDFKQKGFPQIPGLLTEVLRPITSPGLNTPWYSVFGNHDNSVQGTLPSGLDPITALYTGTIKLDVPTAQPDIDRIAAVVRDQPTMLPAALASAAVAGPVRTVTGDPRRAPFTMREYMAAHLAPSGGPGPVGHGFAPDAPQTGITYYSFEIAPGVVGISMDSTNHAGFTDGSIGAGQARWIENLLVAGSSAYYDAAGTRITHSASDTLFVAFSHHTSTSMELPIPDPENPAEPRYTGGYLLDLFGRFPNLVAWVNGHTHDNRVTPHAGPTPDRSFWEINTASHIDFPQNARIVDVCDNADGTLSLFCTLIESAAPYTANFADLSRVGLASMYREMSYNDLGRDPKRIGTAGDHNVELLLVSPFA